MRQIAPSAQLPRASLALRDEAPRREAPRGDPELREELAKWRERVPKLAAALRQRTEELQAAHDELEQLRARPAPADDEALHRAIAERDAASQRNEHLLDTTQLAARQLAAMTTELASLRADLQRQEARASDLAAQLELRERALRDHAQQLTQLGAALGRHKDHVDSLGRGLAEATGAPAPVHFPVPPI
jgi:chromosome segregation ATPase